MARGGRGRLARRAALGAQLEYGPQVSALLTLMEQAGQDFRSGVRATRTSTRGVIRSVRAATPQVQGAYDDAAGVSTQQEGAVATALAGLGRAADGYKASQSIESGAYAKRQADERARALTELAQRGVEARAGGAYQVRALRGQLAGERQRIGSQLQSLAAQEGAATQRNLMDLLDAASQDRLARARINISRDNAAETRRHNRATERNAARNGRPGGMRPLNPNQQNEAFDRLEEARGWIRKLSASRRIGSGRIRAMLRTGSTLQVPVLDPSADQSNGPVYVTDSRGNTKMQSVRVPTFGKDLINAAYDLEVLGYLTRPNVEALHQRGLRIGRRYRVVLGPRRPLPSGISGPPSPNVGYPH